MALVAGFVAFALLDPPFGAIALVVGLLLEIGEAIFWYRYLSRIRVRTGAEGLIGQRATAIEELTPMGRVKIAGEIWNGRCPDGVSARVGETVMVAAVDGLTLRVEPTGRFESLIGGDSQVAET